MSVIFSSLFLSLAFISLLSSTTVYVLSAKDNSLLVKHHSKSSQLQVNNSKNKNFSLASENAFPAFFVNYSDPYWLKSCDPKSPIGGQSFAPPVCSEQNPCTAVHSALKMEGVEKISTSQFTEEHGNVCAGEICTGICEDRLNWARESFGFAVSKLASATTKKVDDGPLKKIIVENVMMPEYRERRYCSFVPPRFSPLVPSSGDHETKSSNDNNNNVSSTTSSPPPLVIYVPPSGDNATGSLYSKLMNLRGVAENKKIVLVAVQAMNVHWHASGWIGPTEDGTKFNDIFKNFTHNDDVKFFDTLIDHFVASGIVDPKRIYILGVSNGLMFASYYGIMRSGSTDGGGLVGSSPELQKLYTGKTPQGNQVAAVSGFSGADPFKGVGWPKECHTRPLPKSKLPFYIVSRICDLVPCFWIKAWMHTLVTEIGAKEAVWVLLDSHNRVRQPSACRINGVKKHCASVHKMLGHALWPEAYTEKMVDFLLQFSLDQD